MYNMIPKIKFREMTLQENIDIIKWAYYEKNKTLSVHDYTIKYFPELANLYHNLSKKEEYKKIEKIVTNKYKQCYKEIKNNTKRYNSLWKEYNDKYFSMLSTYFNIEWPNITIIEATVGLIPVFPRYLDQFSFSIGIVEDWKLIETAAHETLHFMWFEKWKQLHPETPRKEYDSPYLIWQYSEMVTDPILNNKPFSEIFGNVFTERSYDNFYKLKDKNNSVMNVLKNIYTENIPIEQKMNKGYTYIKSILESTSH